MLIKAKTQLLFDNSWLDKLKFSEHSDGDLLNVGALAVKSEDGSVFNFYRTNPLENHSDFKYTKLYDAIPELRKIVDYFSFLTTTRVRIHAQPPGVNIKLHVDDNNTMATSKYNYMIRSITALNADDDFVYEFKQGDEYKTFNLRQGETILFDPDTVYHGNTNNANKTRYALIQIFNSYPVHNNFVRFVNTSEICEL